MIGGAVVVIPYSTEFATVCGHFCGNFHSSEITCEKTVVSDTADSIFKIDLIFSKIVCGECGSEDNLKANCQELWCLKFNLFNCQRNGIYLIKGNLLLHV